MAYNLKDERAFLTFLWLVITLIIVCFLFILSLNNYFKLHSYNKEIEDTLSEDNINYRDIQGILQKQIEDRGKQHLKKIERSKDKPKN